MTDYATLDDLLVAVRQCRICEKVLPLGPHPVLRAGSSARILIVGQAPGRKVHETGIPWNDPSGVRLRTWLKMGTACFYDPARVAIIPMGFCYPGKGRGGDLPPRPECAELWLELLLERLPDIELTLLIGAYAQRHFLGKRGKRTLTETVRAWREYAPEYLPLPHPSPRNLMWLRRNSWFEEEVLPELQRRVHQLNLDTAANSFTPKNTPRM